jgi:hypothetical protein
VVEVELADAGEITLASNVLDFVQQRECLAQVAQASDVLFTKLVLCLGHGVVMGGLFRKRNLRILLFHAIFGPNGRHILGHPRPAALFEPHPAPMMRGSLKHEVARGNSQWSADRG